MAAVFYNQITFFLQPNKQSLLCCYSVWREWVSEMLFVQQKGETTPNQAIETQWLTIQGQFSYDVIPAMW